VIKIKEQTNQEQKILTDELLTKELAVLVDKQVISQRIAEKIKEKIQKNNLTINQNDLIKLIEHIQILLNTKTTGAPKNIERDTTRGTDTLGGSTQTTDILPEKSIPLDLPKNTMYPQQQSIDKEIAVIEKKMGKESGVYQAMQQPIVPMQNTSNQNQYPMAPLTEITNDPEHIVVLLKWLQYLIEKIGNDQLPTLLDYYVDIHWISENVCMDLLKYAKGITIGETEKTKQHHSSNFTMIDHLQSLLYIQKLKGTALTEDFLWKIDNELDRMGRTLHHSHQPFNDK